jgi:hypothetical protein
LQRTEAGGVGVSLNRIPEHFRNGLKHPLSRYGCGEKVKAVLAHFPHTVRVVTTGSAATAFLVGLPSAHEPPQTPAQKIMQDTQAPRTQAVDQVHATPSMQRTIAPTVTGIECVELAILV